ncbi:MAG: hypothetical protein MJ160_03560 [Treponema sp.]|nr:hypothetical protein [Treponema sp.]
MKKICVMIIAAVLSLGAFAQEAPAAKNDSKVAVGASINASIPMGELADYAKMGFGGGVAVEIGIPLGEGLLRGFGVSVRGDFSYLLSDSEYITSFMTVFATANAFLKIPFGSTGVAIQPEIGIGAAINLLSTVPGYEESLNSPYIDQIYSVGFGIRVANPKMAGGKMEIEFTPVYSVSPEKDALVQYVTARVGVMYKL